MRAATGSFLNVCLMRYKHTQFGTAMLISLAVVALLTLSLMPRAEALVVELMLALIGFLFHSLTITVTDDTLHWHFGPGFWKKSVSLSEITSVKTVRTRWYYGLGIRKVYSGWLYTVSGLDAVALTLKGGSNVMLGSNDSVALQAALSKQIQLQT